MAYELELPEGRQDSFHVSCLKKVVGQQVIVSQELPPLDEEGQLATNLEEFLQVRERKLHNMVIMEYRVK